MGGCADRGIGEGRAPYVRITFEIPVNQEGIEFKSMELTQFLAQKLNERFNDQIDYNVYIED